MNPPDAHLAVPGVLPEARGALARHLAEAFERMAAELRGGEYAPGETEPVLDILSTLIRHSIQPGREEPSADADRAPDTGPEAIVDPSAARVALSSMLRLHHALLRGVLDYFEAPEGVRGEIEGTFERLAEGQRELIEYWFGHESLREAELLAQVFHDLRSPLTSVLFLSDALYSGQSGSLSEAQTRQVQLIYTASLTLLTLADNVLSSRNLEAGEVEPEQVPFSLGGLADEIERITRPLAAQRRLDLVFHTDCQTARIGDPDALRRVVLNLVTNAIRYTEEGRVTVRFQDSGSDLVVMIEDTGPGISDEELAYLFTPFRARSPRSEKREREGKRNPEGRPGPRRFSGAGLGLSICHRLTRIMGGEIWVDTELGEGSRFGVQVPFPPVER